MASKLNNPFLFFTDTDLKEFCQIFTEEVRKKVPNINDNAKLQELNKIANGYTYKLSAVVTHKGYKSTETGHYVADILRYRINRNV